MKTQISTLRSGTRNQVLNPKVDYAQLPKASSHLGHSGSNRAEANQIWEQVKKENKEQMTANINGIDLLLEAHWSVSGASVSYHAAISKNDLEEKFGIAASKKNSPFIAIDMANIITVSNGKNSYRYICPSLVEIK
jgi:monoamine oxidase